MSVQSGPIRILPADDQASVRNGFRLILDSQPDKTVIAEAADGVTALDIARRLRPDVVLAGHPDAAARRP
jgi:chemotaxis response regulator CheB